jgi:hypothetical protein
VHEPQKRAPGLRPQAPITGLARQARPAGVAPRILLLTSILIRAADIVLGKTQRTGRAELARIQDRAWALGRRDGAIAARLQKAAVGDIVLMHDGARGINRPDELARVLPAFLERIARDKLNAGSLAE